MSINIDDIPLSELKELQPRIEKKIVILEKQDRHKALLELEKVAKELGFSLAELTIGSSPRKRAPAVPKYANPHDASIVWSGRGRKPRWFTAEMAAGRTPEDLMI